MPTPSLSRLLTTTLLSAVLLLANRTSAQGEADADAWSQLRLREAAAKVELLEQDPGSAPHDRAAALADLGALQQGLGQVEAAAASLERAVAYAPTEARWHAAQARLALRLGRREEAVAAFRLALAHDPLDHASSILLGEVLLENEDWDPAEQAFAAARAGSAFEARATWGLARVAVGRNDDAAAVPLMEAVLAAQPAASSVRYLLAQALRRLGEVDRAREQLGLAGDDSVTMPDWWEERVSTQLLARTADRIRAELDAGLEPRILYARASRNLDPSQDDEADLLDAAADDGRPAPLRARYVHALAGLADGRNEATLAVERLDQALQLDPNLVDGHVRRADLLARAQRLDEAAAGYRKALELDPNESDALFKLASLALHGRDYAEAKALLLRLLEEHPDHSAARLRLGETLEDSGAPTEAEREYERYLDLDLQPHQRADGHHHLMRMRMKANDLQGALQYGKKALEADPGFAPAIADSGAVLVRLGRLEEAGRLYRHWSDAEPRNPTPRSFAAGVLIMGKQEREAATLLEQAHEQFPTDLRISDLLTQLLATSSVAEVRDPKRAISLARAALEVEPTSARVEMLARAHAAAGEASAAADLLARLVAQIERDPRTPPATLERVRRDLEAYRAKAKRP